MTTTSEDQTNNNDNVADLVQVEGHGDQGGHKGHRVSKPFWHVIPQLESHLLGEPEVPRHLFHAAVRNKTRKKTPKGTG